MFEGLNPSQRTVVYSALCGLAGFLAWVGSSRLQSAAQIQIREIPLTGSPSESPAEGTTSPPAPPRELMVHVVGAVKKPGLLRLLPGDRVFQAIEKAGGATKNAQLDLINLAAPVEDGSQIRVPAKGEAAPVPVMRTSGAPRSAASRRQASSSEKKPGPVSLNTATEEQLLNLPGVGPSTAAAILAYRKEKGGFSTIEEIMEVRGIGPKKFEKMRAYLRL